MHIKRVVPVIFALIVSLNISAQHGKVVAAWKYLQDYYNVKDTSSLRNAKESIDVATENPETKQMAKTWVYRGKIYQTLFEQKYQMEYDKRQNVSDIGKRIIEAYMSCNIDYLITANNAYLKARDLDKKKDYDEDITPHLPECARHFENLAIANYNQKNYSVAMMGFEKAMELNSLNGTLDTVNLANAKSAAELAQNNEKTKAFYEKMLNAKIGKASTYHSYQNFLINKMNDPQAASEIVKKGRALYPNDVALINAETNFYLKSNNPDDMNKAISNLKLALEKSPNDAILNLALGNLYDRMANPIDANGKDLPKPTNYDEMLNNAAKCYKAAADINKSDEMAVYDLGALYNNKAKYMLDKANEIKDDNKFKIAEKEAKDVLLVAKGYLEQAYKLNESDCSVILALKVMYLGTSENPKYEEMKTKAKALGCQ